MTQTKLTSDERQVRNRLQEELMDKVIEKTVQEMIKQR